MATEYDWKAMGMVSPEDAPLNASRLNPDGTFTSLIEDGVAVTPTQVFTAAPDGAGGYSFTEREVLPTDALILRLATGRPGLPRQDERTMKNILYRVRWCSCGSKHGAITNITKAEAAAVEYTLSYHFGGRPNKGQWWEKGENGLWMVEFDDHTAVDPPATRPWGWCGRSILFRAWQERETRQDQKRAQARAMYKLGDTVSFEFRGNIYSGIIINAVKRATVLCQGKKYYVPFTLLIAGE